MRRAHRKATLMTRLSLLVREYVVGFGNCARVDVDPRLRYFLQRCLAEHLGGIVELSLSAKVPWVIIAVIVLGVVVWFAMTQQTDAQAQDLPPCTEPTPLPPRPGAPMPPTPEPCTPPTPTGGADDDAAGGASGASGAADLGPEGWPSIPSVGMSSICFAQADGTLDCPWAESSTSTQDSATSTSSGSSGATSTRSGTGGASGAAGNNPKLSHATHFVTCEPSCTRLVTEGVSEFMVNLSTREPRLARPGSWKYYHYFNRMHFAHPARIVTCDNGSRFPEFIGVGIAKGRFADRTDFDNEVIVEAYYYETTATGTKAVCQNFHTRITPVDSSALTFRAYWDANATSTQSYGSGAWKIDIWQGRWNNLGLIPTIWDIAPAVGYGA